MSCPYTHTELEGMNAGLESWSERVYGLFTFLRDMMSLQNICLTGCHHINVGVPYITSINFSPKTLRSVKLYIKPRPKFRAEHRPPTVHGKRSATCLKDVLRDSNARIADLGADFYYAGARCAEYSSCTVNMEPRRHHLAESDVEGVSTS